MPVPEKDLRNLFPIEIGIDRIDHVAVARGQEIHPYNPQHRATYLDLPYLRVLRDVLNYGIRTSNRTSNNGTGAESISLLGQSATYDLRERFPLLTTKKMFSKGVFEELCWMLRGETNVKILQEKGVRIWDEWAKADGDLGPVYGALWRGRWNRPGYTNPVLFDGKDQLVHALKRLQEQPDCRRVIVTAWDPATVQECALAPCHCMFQLRILDGHLYTILTQRSADMFLGVPFNVASYAAMNYLFAKWLGVKPGFLIHNMGDAHVYMDHVEECRKQLDRPARESPTIHLTEHSSPMFPNRQTGHGPITFTESLDHADAKWFEVRDYHPHEKLTAPVSI